MTVLNSYFIKRRSSDWRHSETQPFTCCDPTFEGQRHLLSLPQEAWAGHLLKPTTSLESRGQPSGEAQWTNMEQRKQKDLDSAIKIHLLCSPRSDVDCKQTYWLQQILFGSLRSLFRRQRPQPFYIEKQMPLPLSKVQVCEQAEQLSWQH